MKVTIYVEGGGETNDLRTQCRKAFSKFFDKAGFKGRMPSIVACGSRNAAFDDFKTALGCAATGEFVVLLVDSEAPVTVDSKTKAFQSRPMHLTSRDGWKMPTGATDENVHLMVQSMETWFLADVQALETYFGSGFKKDKLKVQPVLEAMGKTMLMKQLADATAATKSKSQYHDRTKGEHSFEILAELDPEKVRKACPHAETLLSVLNKKLPPAKKL